MRRPANALNVETGFFPAKRCLLKSPDGRGLVWYLSGGSLFAYGQCNKRCPLEESDL